MADVALAWCNVRVVPKVPHLDAQVARDLGLRLRRAREDAGLSQEQVAHTAGISRNHLQVIEQGLSDRASRNPFNPHLSVLLNLCQALQIDVLTVMSEVPGIVVEYGDGDSGGHRPAAGRPGAGRTPATGERRTPPTGERRTPPTGESQR